MFTIIVLLLLLPVCHCFSPSPPSSSFTSASIKHGVANEPTGFAFIDGWSLPGIQPASSSVAAELNLTVFDASFNASSQSLLYWTLYDDSTASWPTVLAHRHDWSCQQLLDVSRAHSPFIWDQHTLSGQMSMQIYENNPHYWFLAIVRCGTQKGEVWPINHVKYAVHSSVVDSANHSNTADKADAPWVRVS
jgi:hypothetical protein